MSTPAEIRQKYGLSSTLKPIKQNSNNVQTKITEYVETIGKNTFFKQMDKKRNQKVTKKEFTSLIEERNLPVKLEDAAQIFDLYSENNQLTRQQLQKMIAEARPSCERKLEDYTVNQFNTSPTKIINKPVVTEFKQSKSDILRIAQAEFARRCQEKYKNQKDVLREVYTNDSVVTKQSLKSFVKEIIPELPQAVDMLVDAASEYNRTITPKIKIPLSGQQTEDKSIIPDLLQDQVLRELLASPTQSSYCQRRDQDQWNMEVEKFTSENQFGTLTESKTNMELINKDSIQQCLTPQIQKSNKLISPNNFNIENSIESFTPQMEIFKSPMYPTLNKDILQPVIEDLDLNKDNQTLISDQQSLPYQKLENRSGSNVTIDDYSTSTHHQNTTDMVKNYFKHTSSSISFQNYGPDINKYRSNSVSYNSRKMQLKHPFELQQNYKHSSPLQQRAKLAFIRGFGGRKTAAAAALIEAYQRSKDQNSFRKNLSLFAPNCTVETSLFLSSNINNIDQLLNSVNLKQEAEVYMNNENFLNGIEKASKENSYKLSWNNACVPIQTNVYGKQDDTLFHSRGNNSSLVHEQFNTKIGDGSGQQIAVQNSFPNEAQKENIPGIGEKVKEQKRYEQVYVQKEDRSIKPPPKIRNIHKSSIENGISNVELKFRSKSGKANYHHDIFNYEKDQIRSVNQKFQQSQIADLIDERNLQW